ncbi:MAG: LysR family transcriptional regulator [Clostridia bacterium]|nr:LysR family transcriptional regulator [Clostridia bacterium]
MDIKKLEYFVACCNAKSISKAAAELYISRQSVSRSIEEIENELGMKLFIRTYSGIELTPNGEYFYLKANEILNSYNHLINTMLLRKKVNKEEIRLSLSLGTQSVFQHKFELFERKNIIELIIEDNSDEECRNKLTNNTADLIAIGRYIDEEGIVCKKVYECPLYLCVNKKNTLSEKEFIDAEDMKNQAIIMAPESFYPTQEVIKYMKEHNVKLNIAGFTSNPSYLLEYVVWNKGAAPIAAFARPIAESLGLVCKRFGNPEIKWELYTAYKAENSSSFYLELIVNEVFSSSE